MATVPELEAQAEELGVRVEAHDGGEKGRWFSGSRRISIRQGMHPVEQLCTLAHEVGHAVLDHASEAAGFIESRQECDADEWAARRLVDDAAYESAELECGSHTGAIARELGVTVHLVEVWRESWARSPYLKLPGIPSECCLADVSDPDTRVGWDSPNEAIRQVMKEMMG